MTFPHPHWGNYAYTIIIFMIGWLVGYWRGAMTMRKCMSGECDVPWCENNPKKN